MNFHKMEKSNQRRNLSLQSMILVNQIMETIVGHVALSPEAIDQLMMMMMIGSDWPKITNVFVTIRVIQLEIKMKSACQSVDRSSFLVETNLIPKPLQLISLSFVEMKCVRAISKRMVLMMMIGFLFERERNVTSSSSSGLTDRIECNG